MVISKSDDDWIKMLKFKVKVVILDFNSDPTYVDEEERQDGNESNKLSSHKERYDVVTDVNSIEDMKEI